jgi:hypothetical protein
MGVGNRWNNKDMGHENIWHGEECELDIVCNLVIFSSQPPKEEGRLG